MSEPSAAPTLQPPWPDLLNLASTGGGGDCTDCDERFVNATGDVMTGSLTLAEGSVVVDSGGLFVKEGADFQGDINQQSGSSATVGSLHVQQAAEFLDNVTLWEDPDQPLEAATKQYVDGRSNKWFDGEGPPVEPVAGAHPGDYYLDTLTGNVYQLTV